MLNPTKPRITQCSIKNLLQNKLLQKINIVKKVQLFQFYGQFLHMFLVLPDFWRKTAAHLEAVLLSIKHYTKQRYSG